MMMMMMMMTMMTMTMISQEAGGRRETEGTDYNLRRFVWDSW
jgi:hypothetical protein